MNPEDSSEPRGGLDLPPTPRSQAGAGRFASTGSPVPYVAPFVVFMLFLAVEGTYFPNQHYLVYPLKTLLVAGTLAWFWQVLPSLQPSAVLTSLLVGVIGVVLWVGLDPWSLRMEAVLERLYNRAFSDIGLPSWAMEITSSTPVGRNPFALYLPSLAWLLFAARLAGISLFVPIMEELFWRGFLMRWLIKEDFASVPLGTYQPVSFWTTTAVFASVHGSEWPLAVVVGILYGGWFVRTKSLGNVMVAHGTTNFLLALYCLFSGDWHFLSTAAPASH